jgi:hypothetical protein
VDDAAFAAAHRIEVERHPAALYFFSGSESAHAEFFHAHHSIVIGVE